MSDVTNYASASTDAHSSASRGSSASTDAHSSSTCGSSASESSAAPQGSDRGADARRSSDSESTQSADDASDRPDARRSSDSESTQSADDASDRPDARAARADPLLDQHADARDEAWVNEHLRHNAPLEHADESVQCPCCFTLLSVRCQPHQRYEGQFRALFVLNCERVPSQRLKLNGERFPEQLYTPVACSTCHTEVAVLDSSGVYHFCNVMY